MSGMPLKTAISDVYPLPSNATANAGFGALWDVVNEFTEKVELDVASAGTIDLGGQLSSKLRITGTTGPITSFGTTFRGPILIRYAAAVAITHNATTLMLPGGANLTTSAGGTMIVYPKATSGTADGWIVAFSSDYIAAQNALKAAKGANSDITSLSGLTDLPSFSAFYGISAQSTSTSNAPLQNDVEDFDTHAAYSPTTYTFTAPAGCAGKYLFNAAVGFAAITTAGIGVIQIMKNGTSVRQTRTSLIVGELASLNISHIMNLAVGDTVRVQLGATSAVASVDGTNIPTYFNGCRIR